MRVCDDDHDRLVLAITRVSFSLKISNVRWANSTFIAARTTIADMTNPAKRNPMRSAGFLERLQKE